MTWSLTGKGSTSDFILKEHPQEDKKYLRMIKEAALMASTEWSQLNASALEL